MFGLALGLLAASAWVAVVWCVDTNSHLLPRQNTNRRNDPGTTQSPQLSPSFGSATMEAAGEATVTWAPAEEADQSLVRAARRKKGAQHRQAPAPSSATRLSAMSTYKQRSSVPEGLVQEDEERLCTMEELEGEQGPATLSSNWTRGDISITLSSYWRKPLEHEDYDTNEWPSSCSHTSGHNATNPGYWFVKFADGQTHHVSKVRLWNRAGAGCNDHNCRERLNGACVRFTTDGTKPSTASPHVESCAMNLPEISSNSGPGSGTEVGIDRDIAGMMFITNGIEAMNICGIKIYVSNTSTSTNDDDDVDVGVYVGVTLVVVLVLVLAVLACLGMGTATGASGGGGHHHRGGEWQEGGDETWGGNADWNAYAGPSGYDVDTHSAHSGHQGHSASGHQGHSGH